MLTRSAGAANYSFGKLSANCLNALRSTRTLQGRLREVDAAITSLEADLAKCDGGELGAPARPPGGVS